MDLRVWDDVALQETAADIGHDGSKKNVRARMGGTGRRSRTGFHHGAEQASGSTDRTAVGGFLGMGEPLPKWALAGPDV